MLRMFGVDPQTGRIDAETIQTSASADREQGSMRTAQVVAGLSPLPPPLWDLDQVRESGQLSPALVDELGLLLRSARAAESPVSSPASMPS